MHLSGIWPEGWFPGLMSVDTRHGLVQSKIDWLSRKLLSCSSALLPLILSGTTALAFVILQILITSVFCSQEQPGLYAHETGQNQREVHSGSEQPALRQCPRSHPLLHHQKAAHQRGRALVPPLPCGCADPVSGAAPPCSGAGPRLGEAGAPGRCRQPCPVCVVCMVLAHHCMSLECCCHCGGWRRPGQRQRDGLHATPAPQPHPLLEFL